MGVIKRRTKTLSYNSDDGESIDSTNESNITFNRFLNNNNLTQSSTTTEINTILNPILSSEDEQMNTGRSTNSTLKLLIDLERRISKQKTPKKRKITRPQPIFNSLTIKGKGERKKRRYENANLITNPYIYKLIKDEDIYKEIDIYDFVPKSISSFALLMNDRDNMETWNEFISLSEDEQEKVLNELDDNDKLENKKIEIKNRPVNSSKKCFNRIDGCLKSVLRKKTMICISIIESIENELILNFKNDPNSIYQIHLNDSFERLLLHALAQYYDLNCYSFNNKHEERWSRVSNKHDCFTPSIDSLTSHLEKLYFETAKN